jgi:transcriptional regulator with XRE-family HTH domain
VTTPLREYREAKNLTLREVARRADVDPGQLSRLERGMETPTIPTLRKIAKGLELWDLDRLLKPYEAARPRPEPLPFTPSPSSELRRALAA